jgi:hypothetical protein
VTALDASAALVAALDRSGGLNLRFRAAVAAAEIASRCAANVTAAVTGEDAGPLASTGLAWQLAGRASTVVHDGLRTGPVDSKGVAAWAQALAGAVRADVGDHDGIAAPRNDRDLPHVGRHGGHGHQPAADPGRPAHHGRRPLVPHRPLYASARTCLP